MKPLLTGEAAERARKAVVGIIDEVRDRLGDGGSAPQLAEAALLTYYVARDMPGAAAEDEHEEWLGRSVEQLEQAPVPLGPFNGLVEVAWILEHLAGEEDDDPVADVDAMVLDHLRSPGNSYDLISGWIGFGNYGSARSRSQDGPAIVGRVLDLLTSAAVPTHQGVAWHTAPELLPEFQRRRAPDGYINFGVAHGIPGVIAWLAQLAGSSAQRQRARDLLEGSVQFLSSALPSREPAYWRPATPDGSFTGPVMGSNNGSWCYGAAGLALALDRAGVVLGDDGVRNWASTIALSAPTETGLRGGCLCHGHAGLALALGTLGARHNDDALIGRARTHMLRVLNLRETGWPTGNDADDVTLLEGAIGIGLALVWATAANEPGWSRLLLA